MLLLLLLRRWVGLPMDGVFEFSANTSSMNHYYYYIHVFNITKLILFLCQMQYATSFVALHLSLPPHTLVLNFCLFETVACILILFMPMNMPSGYNVLNVVKMNPISTMQQINNTLFNDHFSINHNFFYVFLFSATWEFIYFWYLLLLLLFLCCFVWNIFMVFRHHHDDASFVVFIYRI